MIRRFWLKQLGAWRLGRTGGERGVKLGGAGSVREEWGDPFGIRRQRAEVRGHRETKAEGVRRGVGRGDMEGPTTSSANVGRTALGSHQPAVVVTKLGDKARRGPPPSCLNRAMVSSFTQGT